MNPDPCMDRFSQPWPVVKCECLCGVVLIEGEYDGANCSACDAVVCEQCADRDSCRHDACENVYCETCAPKFLPPDAAGLCVTCGSPWRHRRESYQRLAAEFTKELRRTG